MSNKEIVRKFYEEVFNAWDVSKLDQYMRPDYRQHNPTVEDGREGFVRFTQRFFALHPHMEIIHIVEEGDMVMVFFKCTVDLGVNKVCDIYRLQDGLLAEHWDVVQHLDPNASPANGNGDF
ncbi:MAG: nuclear transport factor 2 family protein [Oscillospiraceae bacterium]|nr:nuclear transport factor 2 family protein [Oscillospiraceae bacterium]